MHAISGIFVSFCKTGSFRVQNCHFWSAKLPLLECKTGTFGTQNCHFWNAKVAVLEIEVICFGFYTEKFYGISGSHWERAFDVTV